MHVVVMRKYVDKMMEVRMGVKMVSGQILLKMLGGSRKRGSHVKRIGSQRVVLFGLVCVELGVDIFFRVGLFLAICERVDLKVTLNLQQDNLPSTAF